MTRIFIIINLLVFSVCFANDDFVCSQSYLSKSKTNEILDSMQKSYSAVFDLESDFKQVSYLAALDIEEESSGKLWLKKPGLMKWHYQKPEEQFFLINDNTFWQYNVSEKQATISDFKEVALSDLPTSFLLGAGNIAKDFKVQNSCYDKEKINYIFNLIPKEIKDELKSVSIIVNKNNDLIAVSVVDNSQNYTNLYLINSTNNTSIKNDLFALSIPKGVDINDYREN